MAQDESVPLERYELIRDEGSGNLVVLSRDGTGTTFRALETETRKPVILRLFSEQLLSNRSAQHDFVTRARLLIELDHPAITRIIDTGQAGNRFFYVLEDPGGETLHELVQKKPLDLDKALDLQLQVVEALIAARVQRGLLNRVWPRNLLITPGHPPKIHLLAQNLVNPAAPIEDLEFLAPEVIMGQAETSESTLYSVGATFYFMLTGRAPFPSPISADTLLRRIEESTPDFSLLPPGAPVALIQQLLDREPRARPRSLIDWDRALQRFIRTGTGVSGSPNGVNPLAKELEEIKSHTQRLSVELTKRVQREVDLSNRLKGLESELKKERQATNELRTSGAKDDKIEQLEQEKAALQKEWDRLRAAQEALERDKQSFLKKTQRVSLMGLREEAAREEDKTRSKEAAPKPHLMRLGKKLLEKTTKHRVDTPSRLPVKSASPSQAADKTPRPRAGTSVWPAVPGSDTKGKADAQHSKTQALGPGRTERRSFSAPFENLASRAATDPQPKPPFAKPQVAESPQKPSARVMPPLQPFAGRRDAGPGTSSTERAAAKPKEIPVAKVTTAVPLPATMPVAKSVPQWRRPGEAAPLRRQPPPPRAPEVEASGGAWFALIIGGLVIGLTLYFVPFRTFFGPTPRRAQEPSAELETGEPLGDIEPAEPLAGTTELVDVELWIETKVMENFRLIQNQEWAELLHAVNQLEAKWGKKYPEAVARICQVMSEDLEFSSEFRKTDGQEKDQAYHDLVAYLNAKEARPRRVNPNED